MKAAFDDKEQKWFIRVGWAVVISKFQNVAQMW